MSAPDKQMIERVDNECAICGKTRSQHPTNSGVGMCQIYPIFVSKRDMLNRLSAITPPNGDEVREARVQFQAVRAILEGVARQTSVQRTMRAKVDPSIPLNHVEGVRL